MSDQIVPTEFLTGAAGTGKTFTIKQRIEEDPGCAIICATTGVAAVNLDTVTINSVLHYYDTNSLVDNYVRGQLRQRLLKLAETRPHAELALVVDEVSMMAAEQLDTIYLAIQDVNMGSEAAEPLEHKMNLVLTGDFCQLPPVKARWAFQADCWPEFACNVNRLTKVWRQTDPGFLDAVNAARRGEGDAVSSKLRSLGANFSIAVDLDFDGTTIVAKNDEADRFNQQRLLKIREQSFVLEAHRQGVQSMEWKNIPDRAIFKPTALVMLLANKKDPISGGYQYVNGDLAHINFVDQDHLSERWDEDLRDYIYVIVPAVNVTSVRTGETFWVEQITRENTTRDEPGPNDSPTLYINDKGHYVIGLVTYFPMRLGYCSTVHKTQGLSLDRVQIDCRNGFFGQPSMAYVAISRARSVAGMRIVGGPELLARRVKFNPDVTQWL